MKHRKYIEENRNLFDDMVPSVGHMDRFEALLKQQTKEERPQQRTKKIRLLSIISVAASIAILIAVAIKVRTPEQVEVTPQENVIANDFESVNQRYNQRMQAQISNIMCKLSHTDQENQVMLTEDLQRIIDENAGFVKEMSKNEDKEQAIFYLEKHYEINIQVLEDINEKLGKYTNC
jgi:hypothetical protein